MALATVQALIDSARTLLQDKTAPYRFSDAEFIAALNVAVLEARALRPDLFITATALPSFTAVGDSTSPIDEMYRPAFLYYLVGHMQLRDDEETQDARASAFLTKFTSQLVGATR